MKSTASFFLSGSEICRIIETCKACEVESLDVQGLCITFHSRRNESVDQPGQASDHLTTPVVSDIANSEEKLEMDLMDQSALDEADEAQLMIDNTTEFERVQISRHIEQSRIARISDEKAHA